MDSEAAVILSSAEARVLGCLVEKAALTPETYPLTLNAAVVACNQKTSREPVLELDPGNVGHALRTLEDKGLVKVAHGSRALRYEHRMDEGLRITPEQRALLALLLLRGPQTLAELYTRSERLSRFADLDAVKATLDRLATREPNLVQRLGRGLGQREDRYAHLLCGPVAAMEPGAMAPAAARIPLNADAGLEARVEELEIQVEALRQELATLCTRLDAITG
jgi:uncharacterized protein YceH (UPF0502 family)